jgi:glycosyltransferase involved in cell wall biosynthesis
VLVDDELRRELGRGARRRARQFDPEVLARRWERLLTDVTAG